MTRYLLLCAALLAGPLVAEAQTIRPGAPGEASRSDTVRTAPARIAHVEADVRFMHDMIHHHAQALVMTSLVVPRTENVAVRQIAQRIAISQDDEIALMQRWLEERGEYLPDHGPHTFTRQSHDHHGHDHHHHAEDEHHGHEEHQGHEDHHGHEHHHHDEPEGRPEPGAHHGDDPHAGMPGMLSYEQLAQLAAAQDAEFDRLFLEFMIYHHEGAITMVEELFAADGAGQDTSIFRFASHVESDQQAEILRMRRLLSTLSHDQ